MKRFFFLFAFFFSTTLINAAVVKDTLYIQRDTLTVNGELYTFISFNKNPLFSTTNKNLHQLTNDTLLLRIVNNDSVNHTFTIDGHITTSNLIPSHDSATITVHLTTAGTYLYYSSLNNGAQLGASGVLLVGYDANPFFIWNLFDQENDFSHLFSSLTISSIDTSYHPSLFSINGINFPQTEVDSSTLIHGMVNDSIIIAIANSGHMNHSIHFHGYHLKILNALPSNFIVGREKDSFPLDRGHTLTLLLVPDKSGMFPVHDHNLIGVTNAGTYPGGMMSMLDIMP